MKTYDDHKYLKVQKADIATLAEEGDCDATADYDGCCCLFVLSLCCILFVVVPLIWIIVDWWF